MKYNFGVNDYKREEMRITSSGLILTLLVFGTLMLAFRLQPVTASEIIYIRADGSVDPPLAPISSIDNITYTLVDSICARIVIERDHIIVNGAGCTVRGDGSYGSVGLDLSGRSNVTIFNVTISLFWYAVCLDHSHSNSVSGNCIANNTYIGVYSQDSSNNNYFGNYVAANNGLGFYLANCHNDTIERNNVIANTGTGVMIQDSDFCIVRMNVLIDNDCATDFVNSDNMQIVRNTIADNRAQGVRMEDLSDNNLVSHNNITNNGDGIWAHATGFHTIVYNTIALNARGFALYGAPGGNNTILHNDIVENTVGVYLWKTVFNLFAGNNFNYNGIQVLSEGFANSWNSSYPAGGNYWSDYIGLDANGDGIGDTPYVIDADNQDHYPLMHPWDLWSPVHNINTGLGYAAIQEAINANETLGGHTIFVEVGTYYENASVNKTITLIGENKETTIINCNKTGNAFHVTENNVTISGFTITGSQRNCWKASGIYVNSSNNTFVNNIITDNNWGIFCESAHSNTIRSNLIFNNTIANYITYSNNNTFEKNYLMDNGNGFYSAWSEHNVFNENTICGSEEAAILAMHCSFHTYRGNTLTDNAYGLWLDPVLNSVVFQNFIINNSAVGIRFHGGSFYNVVISNVLIANNEGIFFHDTTRTIVLGNTISRNERGIALYGGSSVKELLEFHHNQIVNNTIGLWTEEYNCQVLVSQNNFVNNYVQVKSEIQSIAEWNDSYPSGGNYWSDYIGTDCRQGSGQNISGSDGIGDSGYRVSSDPKTPLELLQFDKYPLMGPFSDFHATLGDHVQIICNSSISDFQFNGTAIMFNVTGDKGTTGFCRVCVPTSLMNATYRVFVNGTEIISNLLPCSNSTQSYLYFIYTHSIQEVIVIPEFSSFLILLLFMMATLLTIIVHKRKYKT